jgi:hypothetical protein
MPGAYPSWKCGGRIPLTLCHCLSSLQMVSRLGSEPAQPLSAQELRTAARFCRHALKVGWIGKTSITIA